MQLFSGTVVSSITSAEWIRTNVFLHWKHSWALQDMALQESFPRTRDFSSGLCIHSTQKINDMSYNQLISDPSTYVKKRTQQSEDSIILRQMDDVVGSGPHEHLMSDFEHMKTSLYLTDVVVLRHKGDTVSFLGLEIPKTSRSFEVKISTDLVASLLNLYGLENSKTTADPGRRSTVMELASAIHLDGHDYSNFRTAV